MCKLSINNMLWLALMSAVQNKHLPMLEGWRYAVRNAQFLCSWCQELYHSVFFPFFFVASGFENDPIFGQFQSQLWIFSYKF